MRRSVLSTPYLNAEKDPVSTVLRANFSFFFIAYFRLPFGYTPFPLFFPFRSLFLFPFSFLSRWLLSDLPLGIAFTIQRQRIGQVSWQQLEPVGGFHLPV